MNRKQKLVFLGISKSILKNPGVIREGIDNYLNRCIANKKMRM